MTNVLCDYHHGALYYSMHILFEKRLGWKLFRPIGWDWYKKGFWRYSNLPETIKAYLEASKEFMVEDGIYCLPTQEGAVTYNHNAITFKRFIEMDFDFIVASVYNHEEPFHKLIQEHKPNATLIRQTGNAGEIFNPNICGNILNSAIRQLPAKINTVDYHPEFNLDDFRYTVPETHNVISSLLHCLPRTVDAPLWHGYKKSMHNFVWKMYGVEGEDGVPPEHLKAKAMRTSSFIWHLKWGGDGYGFLVHNAYACGRPCIIKGSYYRGKTAEALFEDSVTCIDLELGTKEENVEKIRRFSKPENHVKMCENAYKRFKKVVNFDKEFIQIQEFLKRAQSSKKRDFRF